MKAEHAEHSSVSHEPAVHVALDPVPTREQSAPALAPSIAAATRSNLTVPAGGRAQRSATVVPPPPPGSTSTISSKVQRSPLAKPGPLPTTTITPRVQRHAASAPVVSGITKSAGDATPIIRRKQPSGWTDDQSTWVPSNYATIDSTLVADALSTLDLDANRTHADQWAKAALANGLVHTGSIRSTYKSSYDRDPDAFSVSQNVPDIPQLVVHAHINGDDEVAIDGGVNLKWAHNEIGNKASGITKDVAAGLIDVVAARAHWDSNPDHDRAEEDAADILTGEAIAALFDTTADEQAAAAAKKKAEKDLINWGWKKTTDKKKYGIKLKAAQQAKKDGNPEPMEKLLRVISNAQERQAAAASSD